MVICLFGNDHVSVLLMLIAIQNLLCRSCKYSIFDPIKEMSYIPCDRELRAKGKAAVDVFGYSFAKGSGGWVAMFLLSMIPGSIIDSSKYIMIVCLILIIIWCLAASSLNKMYS